MDWKRRKATIIVAFQRERERERERERLYSHRETKNNLANSFKQNTIRTSTYYIIGTNNVNRECFIQQNFFNSCFIALLKSTYYFVSEKVIGHNRAPREERVQIAREGIGLEKKLNEHIRRWLVESLTTRNSCNHIGIYCSSCWDKKMIVLSSIRWQMGRMEWFFSSCW